ncbi:hypothetical protein OIU84_000977, partial [Salix udensis]
MNCLKPSIPWHKGSLNSVLNSYSLMLIQAIALQMISSNASILLVSFNILMIMSALSKYISTNCFMMNNFLPRLRNSVE